MLTLVVGGEELLAERAVAAAIGSARSADDETEVRRIDAREQGAAGLVEQACSPTLFGGGSVVVVEHLDSGEDTVARAIAAVVAEAPEGVHVVALHAGGPRGRKSLDALKRVPHTFVECGEVKRGRAMAEFAASELRGHHKVATAEALALIVAVNGADIREVAASCAQLASDIPDRSITPAHVRTYLGSAVDVTAFEICDAVLGREAVKALRLLRAAELGDRGSLGPLVVAALARGLRQVARYQVAPPGMSDRDLAASVGVPQWRVRTLAGQARRWRPEDLAAALVVLGGADAAMKGGMREGEQLDPHQKLLALEQVIVRLARPARAPQA